ncbi:MAG: alpha/beta hydrolase [Microbacteriaceae bacterium]|nr:alpha/beta hydrolase [Microbacteriaceae bacterium]
MSRRAVLLHGLSSSPDGWWRVRAFLEERGWEVETPALLGHGGRGPAPRYVLEDYVDDLRGLRTDLLADLLVGHSLGGAAATMLAAADPDVAERLILLDPVWHVPVAELPAVAAEQVAELANDEASLRESKPHWDERDVQAKLAAIRSVQPDAVARTFAEARTWDIRPDAARLRTPTLVLGGDPAVYTMLEPADAHAAAEASGAIDYVVIEGAGHSPHRDEPEATLEAIGAWLARG